MLVKLNLSTSGAFHARAYHAIAVTLNALVQDLEPGTLERGRDVAVVGRAITKEALERDGIGGGRSGAHCEPLADGHGAGIEQARGRGQIAVGAMPAGGGAVANDPPRRAGIATLELLEPRLADQTGRGGARGQARGQPGGGAEVVGRLELSQLAMGARRGRSVQLGRETRRMSRIRLSGRTRHLGALGRLDIRFYRAMEPGRHGIRSRVSDPAANITARRFAECLIHEWPLVRIGRYVVLREVGDDAPGPFPQATIIFAGGRVQSSRAARRTQVPNKGPNVPATKASSEGQREKGKRDTTANLQTEVN